ncbi:MAG TPA: nuclear transport factor 2 family protein [Thermoanaerobaculia bacterium]
MKRLALAFLLVASSALADTITDVEAIRKNILTYTEAVIARDPEPIMALFAPDILLSFPGIPDQDYETLRKEYAEMRSRAPGEVTTRPDIEEILVSGDLAVARIVWNTTVTREGAVTKRQMKDLQVWRREPSGKWRFIRGMHYRIPQ